MPYNGTPLLASAILRVDQIAGILYGKCRKQVNLFGSHSGTCTLHGCAVYRQQIHPYHTDGFILSLIEAVATILRPKVRFNISTKSIFSHARVAMELVPLQWLCRHSTDCSLDMIPQCLSRSIAQVMFKYSRCLPGSHSSSTTTISLRT